MSLYDDLTHPVKSNGVNHVAADSKICYYYRIVKLCKRGMVNENKF